MNPIIWCKFLAFLTFYVFCTVGFSSLLNATRYFSGKTGKSDYHNCVFRSHDLLPFEVKRILFKFLRLLWNNGGRRTGNYMIVWRRLPELLDHGRSFLEDIWHASPQQSGVCGRGWWCRCLCWGYLGCCSHCWRCRGGWRVLQRFGKRTAPSQIATTRHSKALGWTARRGPRKWRHSHRGRVGLGSCCQSSWSSLLL